MKRFVAPSLLAADKNRLLDEILLAQNSGAEYIHWDIMDGIFVPNTSFSVLDVKNNSKKHKLINDVHIMVDDPFKYANEFIEAGADIITFHIEAISNSFEVSNLINLIHNRGCKVGISIKPKTNINDVLKYLKDIDLVLVMSVEPGKGGQAFIESSLDKIKFLSSYIISNNLDCLIEVDGGINDITGKQCRLAGADILVAGSYLYGHNDFMERIKKIR